MGMPYIQYLVSENEQEEEYSDVHHKDMRERIDRSRLVAQRGPATLGIVVCNKNVRAR